MAGVMPGSRGHSELSRVMPGIICTYWVLPGRDGMCGPGHVRRSPAIAGILVRSMW